MSPESLIILADRITGRAGPDRTLDCLIGELLGPDDDGWQSGWPRFTASIDAAMVLMPPDAFWRVGHDGDGPDPSQFKATVSTALEGPTPISFQSAVADTAPLALCAAALRARAVMGDAA